MKKILNCVKQLVILALILGSVFSIYFAVKINKPLTTSGEEKVFSVVSGQTSSEIVENLANADLISGTFFFKTYIYFKKTSDKIQAGNFLLSPRMSIREIAEVLTSGKVIDDSVKFTILEGWQIKDIAKSLAEAGIVNASKFGSEAGQEEGYLFPDTYFFSKTESVAGIIKKFRDNFDKKVDERLRREIDRQGKSLKDVIILASIIEREVGRNVKKGTKLSAEELGKLSEERRLVASVFYNRFKIGKPLESDATVTYLTGSKSNRATLAELKIDSPYNTYKYRDLPPGPIANPSLDSILAAIYPAESDYLYFITNEFGEAHFARYLEEHIQNRAKYLK